VHAAAWAVQEDRTWPYKNTQHQKRSSSSKVPSSAPLACYYHDSILAHANAHPSVSHAYESGSISKRLVSPKLQYSRRGSRLQIFSRYCRTHFPWLMRPFEMQRRLWRSEVSVCACLGARAWRDGYHRTCLDYSSWLLGFCRVPDGRRWFLQRATGVMEGKKRLLGALRLLEEEMEEDGGGWKLLSHKNVST
jgi:hypothetical protein